MQAHKAGHAFRTTVRQPCRAPDAFRGGPKNTESVGLRPFATDQPVGHWMANQCPTLRPIGQCIFRQERTNHRLGTETPRYEGTGTPWPEGGLACGEELKHRGMKGTTTFLGGRHDEGTGTFYECVGVRTGTVTRKEG